jgi:hypothetical protein
MDIQVGTEKEIGYNVVVTITLDSGSECTLGTTAIAAIAAVVGPKLLAIPGVGPAVSGLIVAQLSANAADIKSKDTGKGVLVVIHLPIVAGIPRTDVKSRSETVATPGGPVGAETGAIGLGRDPIDAGLINRQ